MKNQGAKAIEREEKRLEKEHKKKIEAANKMLIPVNKKTSENLGLISFEPYGTFRLTNNRWLRVFTLKGSLKDFSQKLKCLTGSVRITLHQNGAGGRDTCYLSLMEKGEVFDEVRKKFQMDEALIEEMVKIKLLSVDEVMNLILRIHGKEMGFSYASYVRGNKDWKKECFADTKEENEKIILNGSYGVSTITLIYPEQLKEGYLRNLMELGSTMYISIDIEPLKSKERASYVRSLEMRYNKRLGQEEEKDVFSLSLSMLIFSDSEDALAILDSTVKSLTEKYEMVQSKVFSKQKAYSESILSFGILEEKAVRIVTEEVLKNLVGGIDNADA